VIDGVITFGAGHFYISQSDKGGLVFGGDIDGYNSYAQRGNLPVVEDVMRRRHGADAGDRPRADAAHWGGIMDMSMDGSPIIDHTRRRPLSQCRLVLWRLQGDAGLGLVLRASAGARRTAPVAIAFRLDRFATGAHHRRKGRRRPTEPALRPHAHPLSLIAGSRDASASWFLSPATPR
jgi:hypothetical protein